MATLGSCWETQNLNETLHSRCDERVCYRDARECADMEALETNICTLFPDLVITDMKMPGGNICDLMSKMRRGEVGDNLRSRHHADFGCECGCHSQCGVCGVDDILAVPIPLADLFGRIKTGLEMKLFVVTSDYIGPYHRGWPRRRRWYSVD